MILQSALFHKPRAGKKSNLRVSASHDENNLHSAKEILADVAAFGGEDSGLVRWARVVVQRLETET